MPATVASGLFRLPPEIREAIYHELLHPQNNFQKAPNPYQSQPIAGENEYKRYNYSLRFMRTNQQMYYEARRVFRRLNSFVKIQTPWSEAEQHVAADGYVPVLATGDVADRFRYDHMTVAIDAPQRQMPTDGCCFILHLNDLDIFCKFWFYSHLNHPALNPFLRLTLRLRNPYASDMSSDPIPKELQRQLLRPFGQIKNLRDVVVEGAHLSSVEKEMRDNMKEPLKTSEECLEEATRLKDSGNTALQKGDFQGAIQRYTESFLAMHIVVDGRRRTIYGDAHFQHEIADGPLKGQHAQLVRLSLRVKLVANMVWALWKSNQVEKAHFWGMRSIRLMREAVDGQEPVRDFVAAEPMGKIYYRTALCCRRMGDDDEAKSLLQVAVLYLPRDELVRKEYQELVPRIG